MNIEKKESLYCEFKSDRKRISDDVLLENVVAFANTEGGMLYIGVEDDGAITGVDSSHFDITQLAAFIANRTVPPLAVRTSLIEDFDMPIVGIEVPKVSTIVATSSGKIVRRRLKINGEPENVPMYPHEITSRLSDLKLLDFSAQKVLDAIYSDLDPVERERLRNIIRQHRGETSLLELSDEELDKALRFVTVVDGMLVPTYTGLLTIGRKEKIAELMPTVEAAIQILSGTEVKLNESFTLPILAAFERIFNVIMANNVEDELEDGLFRIGVPKIEPRAFREALVNAFCHRDYAELGRVRVQLDDEGLTISNPGGFIEDISFCNLLDAEPQGRNQALADALKRIGLAERTGRGIDRIYEGALIYGKRLPDYSASTSKRVEVYMPNSAADEEFMKFLRTEQKNSGKPFSVKALMVLYLLKLHGKLTFAELHSMIGSGTSRIESTLESLLKRGIIVESGKYYMMNTPNVAKESRSVFVTKPLEVNDYERIILEFARAKGSITRNEVISLLPINGAQAYRLLKKLADQAKLKLVGVKKAAKYIVVEK